MIVDRFKYNIARTFLTLARPTLPRLHPQCDHPYQRQRYSTSTSSFPLSPSLTSESDHALARKWLEQFKQSDIPKDALKTSYSRSSGPGGQHVNKTNSKATVKCDLGWLPPFVLDPLRRSPHYLPSPPSLQISSQATRTAGNNMTQALSLIHGAIASAAQSVIVGETSDAQKDKVRRLARAEDGRRREMKDKRSSKKAARRDW